VSTSFPVPDLVYRGLKNRKCIDATHGVVTPEAYIRREGEEGISVATSPQAVRDVLETLRGIAELAVTDIRSIVNRATGTPWTSYLIILHTAT
jgi:hypothetical protein